MHVRKLRFPRVERLCAPSRQLLCNHLPVNGVPSRSATSLTAYSRSTTCATASRLNSSVNLFLDISPSLLPKLPSKVSTNLGAIHNNLPVRACHIGDIGLPSSHQPPALSASGLFALDSLLNLSVLLVGGLDIRMDEF